MLFRFKDGQFMAKFYDIERTFFPLVRVGFVSTLCIHELTDEFAKEGSYSCYI